MGALRQTTLLATLLLACAGSGERRDGAPVAPEPETMADPPPAAPAPAVSEPPTPEVVEVAPKPVAEPTPAVERVGPAQLARLPESQATIFLSSPEDPATELRLGVTKARRGKHYLAGNEKTLQAFYPHIRDVGGGYVGVGSDQAYLLIGWMRAEVAWFIDYDKDVVDVHAVYRVFFDNAETPDALLALWTAEEKKRAAALIEQAHPGERGQHLRKLYLNNRGWIHRRLKGVTKRLVKAKVPSYLNDQDTYDYVRSFLQAGRARPLLANLLQHTGFRGVADAAQRMQVAVKILYLSNAEEYWKQYPQSFRDNVAALPFADDAKILRTLLIWDVNEDYRYNVQPARNYVEWLSKPYTKNVYDIVHKRGAPDPAIINVFETDEPPGNSPASRAAAKE